MDDNQQRDDEYDPERNIPLEEYFGTDTARHDLTMFRTELELKMLELVQEYLALGISPYELMGFLRNIIDLS